MEQVPVADNIIEQKLFGFRVKRLLKAVVVPMSPFLLTMVFPNTPILISMAAFLFGLAIGSVAFFKTPPSQEPHLWIWNAIRLNLTEGEYERQPVGEEVTYQDNYQAITPEDGTKRTKTAPAPQDVFEPLDMFGNSTNTLDVLEFDRVEDDGILVAEDEFKMLVEIDPRDWLILSNDERANVSQAYARVLKGVEFPFQVKVLPVDYRNEEYEEHLKRAHRKHADDEPDILTHLRQQHLQWLNAVIETASVTERKYYFIVSIEREEESVGLLDSLLSGDSSLDEDLLKKEVYGRADGLQSDLTKTGVSATLLDSRSEVLRVVYYDMHDELPEYEPDHEPFTTLEEAM